MFDHARYRTFLFDCDGVIMDSNDIKTRAFYELAVIHGEDVARQLVSYHKKNGGVSRFRKLEYLYREILCRQNCDNDIADAVARYGEIVRQKLMTCSLTKACKDFLRWLPTGAPKFVISGGLENELKDVFKKRGLTRYFDGIFGSPRPKEKIVHQLIEGGGLIKPAVFFGDTCYDHQIAQHFGLDFVFLYGYSEVEDPDEFLRANDMLVQDFSCLIGK